MLRVVPSQIVAQIDRSFRQVDSAEIGEDRAPDVAVVLALVDRLEDPHLLSVAPDDYVSFTAATEIIRALLDRWRTVDMAERNMQSPPVLKRMHSLGQRHPMHVVRTVLAGCADTPPHPSVGTLGFLGSSDLAEALRLDSSVAICALASGEFKAAAVIAGSVIEAFLLWALKRKPDPDIQAGLAAWKADWNALGRPQGQPQPPQAVSTTAWDKWNLASMIAIARRIAPVPVISAETADAANSAREFRNLIHPERADKTRPTLGTAQIAVGAMQRVAEELESLVAAGKL